MQVTQIYASQLRTPRSSATAAVPCPLPQSLQLAINKLRKLPVAKHVGSRITHLIIQITEKNTVKAAMSNQQYYGGSAPNQGGYGQNPNQQYPPPNQQYSNPNTPYGGPPSQHYNAPAGAPPGHRPPQRVGTEAGLPQGQERSEQLEHLQNYEASAPQTTADKDQETLRKEFPNIDSSLIAALYADSESLGATREMLHELSSPN